jgi:hypothetical protein
MSSYPVQIIPNEGETDICESKKFDSFEDAVTHIYNNKLVCSVQKLDGSPLANVNCTTDVPTLQITGYIIPEPGLMPGNYDVD